MGYADLTNGYNGSYSKQSQRWSRGHLALLLLVAVILVVLGYAIQPVYNAFQRDRVNSAGAEFIKALAKEDYGTVYNKMVTQNVRENQTEEQFKASMANLQSTDPKFDVELSTRDKNTASYYAKVSNLPPAPETGKTDGEFNLAMVKQDGEWLIDIAVVQ